MIGRTRKELEKAASKIGYIVEIASPLAVRRSLAQHGKRAKYQVRILDDERIIGHACNLEQLRQVIKEAHLRHAKE